MVATTDLHLEVDFEGSGTFAGSYDDVTAYTLPNGIQTITGRDKASSLTGKASPGQLRALLNNSDDRFSPFNASSVLSVTPTFVAAGSSSTGNGAAPTPTLPAGVALGDCMVCFFYSKEATDGTVAISTGWTQIYNARSAGGLLALWYRIYQTGDSAPTFTLGGHAAGDDVIAHIAAWRHVNTARPIGAKGTLDTNTSAQDIGAITGITLGAKALLIVAGGKLDDWTSVATLSQSGMTFAEIGEPDATTGNDAGLVWDYATVDAGTALAVTSKTFAVTGGSSAAGKGVMFSLNPESKIKPGLLVRLRDDSDVLWVGRLARIVPDVQRKQIHTASLEAVGIMDEVAKLEIVPLASGTGAATGTLIAAALDDVGLEDSGIETGDITTGLFGTTGSTKVDLLSELRKLEEIELGFLHEDTEEYRLLFHDRSHREALTTSLATFSDDPNDSLHYESVVEEAWSGYIFNRCIAGVSPYTLGEESVLVTLPGPYSMNPGGSTDLVAQYSAAPLAEWSGHTRDIYYGSNVPVHQSDTESGATSATPSFTLPATITADDLLLAFVHAGTTITAGPAGWTEIASVDLSGSSGKYFKVYAFKAAGTEDGGTISVTLNVSAAAVCQVHRYTSWNGKISEIEVSTVSTGTGTAPNPPSITPSWGALKAMFVTAAIASAGITNFTEPSGYSTANPLLLTSGSSYYFATAYRAESTGTASEDAGVWALDASRNYATFTIAIRGARSVSSGVTGSTPNTRDGAFTISYDNSLGGGVGQQDHENIRVNGTNLEEGDAAYAQADYLPSQAAIKGVGIRTYRNPAELFASVDDAQTYADEVVKDFGEAHPYISMSYMANQDDTHYAQALARKVGDRITLKANQSQPGAGLGINEDFFVESIAHEITKTRHQVTYQLSPASVSDV